MFFYISVERAVYVRVVDAKFGGMHKFKCCLLLLGRSCNALMQHNATTQHALLTADAPADKGWRMDQDLHGWYQSIKNKLLNWPLALGSPSFPVQIFDFLPTFPSVCLMVRVQSWLSVYHLTSLFPPSPPALHPPPYSAPPPAPLLEKWKCWLL